MKYKSKEKSEFFLLGQDSDAMGNDFFLFHDEIGMNEPRMLNFILHLFAPWALKYRRYKGWRNIHEDDPTWLNHDPKPGPFLLRVRATMRVQI